MSENNYHEAILRSAGDFELASLKSKTLPVHSVEEVSGKVKDEGHNRIQAAEVQSYRFPVDKFTAESAKKWLKDNKITFKSFEEAKPKEDAGITKTSAGDILIAKSIFGNEARIISAYENAIAKTTNPGLKTVLSSILVDKKVRAEQLLKWYAHS
jgi:hypothetical protein